MDHPAGIGLQVQILVTLIYLDRVTSCPSNTHMAGNFTLPCRNWAHWLNPANENNCFFDEMFKRSCFYLVADHLVPGNFNLLHTLIKTFYLDWFI